MKNVDFDLLKLSPIELEQKNYNLIYRSDNLFVSIFSFNHLKNPVFLPLITTARVWVSSVVKTNTLKLGRHVTWLCVGEFEKYMKNFNKLVNW